MTQVATDIMLYMSAQNELSGRATANIEAIKSCTTLDNMCMFILLDTLLKNAKTSAVARQTWQYRLPPGADDKAFKEFVSKREDEDAADAETFRAVLNLAEQHFNDRPTQQKMLVFWGHGGGMEFLDEQMADGVTLARASIAEFAGVLADKSNGRDPLRFDIVAFDSCYMCMIETMYELRDACSYALCSSTIVDADGYPYEKIVAMLKKPSPTVTSRQTANLVADIYDKHYGDFPNRFLFVCDLTRIATCIAALNALGTNLTTLLTRKSTADSVRAAISEALIEAGENSSYVYVLRFMKALPACLESRIDAKDLNTVKELTEAMAAAVLDTFDGRMGDTVENPISPQIWAPVEKPSYMLRRAEYNSLDASDGGSAGWAAMWKTYHGLDDVAVRTVSKPARMKIAIA